MARKKEPKGVEGETPRQKVDRINRKKGVAGSLPKVPHYLATELTAHGIKLDGGLMRSIDEADARRLQQMMVAERDWHRAQQLVTSTGRTGPSWPSDPIDSPIKSDGFTVSFQVPHQKWGTPEHWQREQQAREQLADVVAEKIKLGGGWLDVSTEKDNILEVTTVTLQMPSPSADQKKPKAPQPKADKKSIGLVADQVDQIIKAETAKVAQQGYEAALKIIDDLQENILPETSGRYIADLLWFRLNKAMENQS